MSTPPDYDLDTAYRIDGPEDAVRLYRGWAESYDTDFAKDWGYVAPRAIAQVFRAHAGRDDQPVLDVGAGTGLVAAELADWAVDGIDISAEMLAIAAAKGLYRDRIEADLTKPLAIGDARYGSLISCGTFTHGHVGPECFAELLRIARPGALFCLGTLAAVLDGAGIGSALARLVAARRITPVDFREIRIYEGVDHPHADDRGLVMVFRSR